MPKTTPEFTPGPWSVEPHTAEGWYVCGPHAEDPLRDLNGMPDSCTFTNKADAILISEAPAMYKVLCEFPGINCDTEDILRWIRRRDMVLQMAQRESSMRPLKPGIRHEG